MAFTRDQLDLLMGYARRLDAAGHGERGRLIDELCALHAWSKNTFYSRMKLVGWASGRKARADKGSSSQDLAALEFIAAERRQSVRKNGKQTMFTPVARSIAAVNGHDVTVSVSQINRLMRARRLDVASQQEAHAPVTLRYAHPNHVHQADPSLCLVYYLKGRQFLIGDDEFYKNKLDKIAEIRLKCWRYVLADPCSGVELSRYYERAGERAEDLIDFLLFCWEKQPERRFHGVPAELLTDGGSKATVLTNLCRALEVTPRTHAPGNARAKGAVEGANNRKECGFESRLRLQPVHDVAELNRHAAAFDEAWNANAIPFLDTRLHRHGLPEPIARYDLWMRITAAQLRVLPDRAIVADYLEGRSETRKVSKTVQISFRHPQDKRVRLYDVGGIAGICVGDKLEVTPLIFGDCAINVRVADYQGDDVIHRLEPIADSYDGFGYHTDAPLYGEAYARRPDTDADRAAKRLDKVAYPQLTIEEAQKARAKNVTPFDGQVDALDHLSGIEVPAAIARRGTAIALSSRVVEAEPLSAIQVAKRLRTLGIERADLYAVVTRDWPQGMPEDELAAYAAQLSNHPALRAVGE